MSETKPAIPGDPGLEVSTFFVRSRNSLLARADFGPLYVDYYLHHSDHKIRYPGPLDALFKHALAGLVLHCASRPWNEMVAWTLHFEKLGVNLFLTGDNETGTVTGRLFEENVKEMGGNFFYADVVRGKEAKRRSMAEFAEDDPLAAISAFYKHSEQRGVRAVQTGEETYALLTEHPDCDEAWFNSITPKDLAAVDTLETVVPMERRLYRWFCGCNQQRMLQVVAPIYREGPEELFAGDPSLEMRCPRCAARHIVTREAMEAYVHKEPGK